MPIVTFNETAEAVRDVAQRLRDLKSTANWIFLALLLNAAALALVAFFLSGARL